MLDIIIILMILLMGFIASRKGFIKVVYQLTSFILSLGISLFLYPIMNEALKITPIYAKIKAWNIEKISSIEVVGGLQAQSRIIKEATWWLPSSISEQMIQNNNPEIYTLMNVDNLIDYISTYISNICISALSILIVWIIVRIGLSIGVKVLDLFSKLPLLNFTNKTAGFILGLIQGTCTIWLIYLIIPFITLVPKFENILVLINESILGQWLYNNNLILNYLNQIFLK